MEQPDNTPDQPRRAATWTVHRQDDNGNRFIVETGLSQEAAEELVAVLEGRRHKQLYWAESEQTG